MARVSCVREVSRDRCAVRLSCAPIEGVRPGHVIASNHIDGDGRGWWEVMARDNCRSPAGPWRSSGDDNWATYDLWRVGPTRIACYLTSSIKKNTEILRKRNQVPLE